MMETKFPDYEVLNFHPAEPQEISAIVISHPINYCKDTGKLHTLPGGVLITGRHSVSWHLCVRVEM